MVGCQEDVNVDRLRMEVIHGIGNLPIYHFCKAGGKAKYEIKILDVYDASRRKYGYVCAVKIELFCCVVFSCNPDSWIVKARLAKRLRVTEWTDMMVAADPGLMKEEKSHSEFLLIFGFRVSRVVIHLSDVCC